MDPATTAADDYAAALTRQCPVCYATAGSVCNRGVTGEFTAFPVPLPRPFRWWSGPRWVHLHAPRLTADGGWLVTTAGLTSTGASSAPPATNGYLARILLPTFSARSLSIPAR